MTETKKAVSLKKAGSRGQDRTKRREGRKQGTSKKKKGIERKKFRFKKSPVSKKSTITLELGIYL